jgi:hypothetical protein
MNMRTMVGQHASGGQVRRVLGRRVKSRNDNIDMKCTMRLQMILVVSLQKIR